MPKDNPHGYYGKKHNSNSKRTHGGSNPREPGKTGRKFANPGSSKTVRSRHGKRVRINRRSKRG